MCPPKPKTPAPPPPTPEAPPPAAETAKQVKSAGNKRGETKETKVARTGTDRLRVGLGVPDAGDTSGSGRSILSQLLIPKG